jgi:hypothetical protein
MLSFPNYIGAMAFEPNQQSWTADKTPPDVGSLHQGVFLSKRTYTYTKELKAESMWMCEARKIRQAIADKLGLEIKQITNWRTEIRRRRK